MGTVDRKVEAAIAEEMERGCLSGMVSSGGWEGDVEDMEEIEEIRCKSREAVKRKKSPLELPVKKKMGRIMYRCLAKKRRGGGGDQKTALKVRGVMLHQSDLASLVTLLCPLIAPPRQFAIDLSHIDLSWVVKKESIVPTLNLLTMPATPGHGVMLNSPRSVLILLRNGISPSSLLEESPKEEAKHIHHLRESNRVRLLADLRHHYRTLCRHVTLEDILDFYENYDPSEPSAIHDSLVGGNVTCVTPTPRTANTHLSPTSSSRKVSTSRRTQQEANDPAFAAARAEKLAKRMDLKPLLTKMDKTREKMQTMLDSDIKAKLSTLSDRQEEQGKRVQILRRHATRLKRVEQDRSARAEAKQMVKEAKQKRRQLQLEALQVTQEQQLLEKQQKEDEQMRRKKRENAVVLKNKKQRRSDVKKKLEERLGAAKELEMRQLQDKLDAIDEKERIFAKVTERRETMQAALRQQGAENKVIAEEKRNGIEQMLLERDQMRAHTLGCRFQHVDTRLAAFNAQKAIALEEKIHTEQRAADARVRAREEAAHREEDEYNHQAEQRQEREMRFQQRKTTKAKRSELRSMQAKQRFREKQDGVDRMHAAAEFKRLQIHNKLQWKTDRISNLHMQIDIITEKTRKARETILVDKETRTKALNELTVQTEKRLYQETCKAGL